MQDGASNSPNAKCRNTALSLIARAEQCTSGLRRKLEKRGFEPSHVDAVISELLEMNLLNDGRFARLWIESRLRLAKSPLRLLVSLCNRGIERREAEAALRAVLDEETELAILTRFAEKYARKAGNQGTLKYALSNEGFSRGAIQRYFNY